MTPLVAFKCTNCGHIHYPEHARCAFCGNRQFEKITAEGTAKLLTFTEVRTLPWGIDERCRTLGIAEFANKVRAMGWLRVAKPKLGMKLKAEWAPVRVIRGEQAYGLAFSAAD
jgi:uncharacterized OB-fold protein